MCVNDMDDFPFICCIHCFFSSSIGMKIDTSTRESFFCYMRVSLLYCIHFVPCAVAETTTTFKTHTQCSVTILFSPRFHSNCKNCKGEEGGACGNDHRRSVVVGK